MYVKFELQDDRFCDSCPVWCECEIDTCSLYGDFSGRNEAGRYPRPQACIDASEEIERLVSDDGLSD